MVLEDKGLPGLCVLKAQTAKDCECLQKHLLSKGWRALFLRKEDDTSTMSQPVQKDVVSLELGNLIRYDPFKYILENSKRSQHVILSPAPSVSWRLVKKQMDKLLTDDGVKDSCVYDACRPELYGSPHDYIHVQFMHVGTAVSWYDKHNGHLDLVFPETPQQKEFKFRMQLYYSDNAWNCRCCPARNFPKRTLCHKCYAHRDGDSSTTVSISTTPTRWVGISGLKRTISGVEQVKKSLPQLDSFTITRMQLIKEQNPMLNVGLCIIETPSPSDGQTLTEYINNYDAKIKLVFVTLNPASDLSKMATDHIDSTLLLIRSDETFSNGMPECPDNTHAWWQKFNGGIQEGEDTLKNLFQDQSMPFPTDDTVFVPFPPKTIIGDDGSKDHKISLLKESGVEEEVAEKSRLYKGKNVGGPCSYVFLKFKSASDARAWRAKHDGKWVIPLENGASWTSFLRPSVPNWGCKKCTTPNFPLRLYCFWCYEPRDGGAPLVTVADSSTRFVGVTKFQDWCATEEILFENMKLFRKMKDNQQLKKVHYPTEPSGIPLGLCVLEFESIAVAGQIFAHLIPLTLKRHTIVYVEENSLIHNTMVPNHVLV